MSIASYRLRKTSRQALFQTQQPPKRTKRRRTSTAPLIPTPSTLGSSDCPTVSQRPVSRAMDRNSKGTCTKKFFIPDFLCKAAALMWRYIESTRPLGDRNDAKAMEELLKTTQSRTGKEAVSPPLRGFPAGRHHTGPQRFGTGSRGTPSGPGGQCLHNGGAGPVWGDPGPPAAGKTSPPVPKGLETGNMTPHDRDSQPGKTND